MTPFCQLLWRAYPVPDSLPLKPNGYIFNWFSNMVPLERPIRLFGLDFHNTEGAFVAAKTVDPLLRAEAARISARNPYKVKTFGKTLPLRPAWDETRLAAMWIAISAKFTMDRGDGVKLLASSGPLVEWTNWGRDGDRDWGVGHRDGEGLNGVGLLLELQRGRLRIEAKGGAPARPYDWVPETDWPGLQTHLVACLNRIRPENLARPSSAIHP